MTIHGPGSPIYRHEIQAEFGGGNPMYLSNYYAGGPYVPAGAIGSYGPIPSSGPLHMSWFYGASKSQTLSVGVGHEVIGGSTHLYGYEASPAYGSCTPNTLACKGGAFIRDLYWYSSINGWLIQIDGSYGNDGFTTMNVNGNVYYRTDASYYTDVGRTSWFWGSGAFNPFGTGGTISVVVT